MLENAVREAAAKAVCDPLGLHFKPGTAVLAASIREILLRIDLVSAITALSVPMINEKMRQGRFPRPLKITDRGRAWRLSEVLEWVDGLRLEEAS